MSDNMNEDLKTVGYGIKGKPTSNAVTKEDFQNRVKEVFDDLKNILSKSFGAYGAPTFISNLASTTVTKDGFTIMKNLVYDTEKGDPVDHIIYNMASDICARLNYKVGDGTTTAIIASTSIYERYMASHKEMEKLNLIPRDVIRAMKEVQEEIVEGIKKKAVPICNTEDVVEKIRKIVKISSNNDKEITDMISTIYEKTGSPYINCKLSKDGRTKMNIIDGFQAPITLADKLFVNSDEMKAVEKNIEVLLFDHKISGEAYSKIIKPLSGICSQCGRKLLIVAPTYDEVAFNSIIKRDLMSEYNARGTNNTIFTVVSMTTSTQYKAYNDLAMLLNTIVIDSTKEDEILDKIEKEGREVYTLFDVSGRHIPGINIAAYVNNEDKERHQLSMMQDDGERTYETGVGEDAIRVGFADHLECGFSNTIFTGFYYNKHMYNAMLKDAKDDLDDVVEKYSRLGNFSYDIMRAQRRYNSLNLKVAEIEVGGDSQLSQRMLKDTVDDAILAAESAYNNGYILGCNLTTLQVIGELISKYSEKMLNKDEKDTAITKIVVLGIIYGGFQDVYKTVLANAYNENASVDIKFMDIVEKDYSRMTEDITNALKNMTGSDIIVKEGITEDDLILSIEEALGITFTQIREYYNDSSITDQDRAKLEDATLSLNLLTFLVSLSIEINKVFDLETKKFTQDIINSANTDIQVLIASMDLLTLLINGNQLVITSKNNFQQC